MSYNFYKVLHVTSLFLLFLSLGGITLYMIGEQTKEKIKGRRWALISHGLAMFLSLVGGFGLLARLGFMAEWPLWVWFKLIIWLVMGLAPTFIMRIPILARSAWIGVVVLGVLASYLANYKPF